MSELVYWVWLSEQRGLGARTVGRLLRVFGTPERVYYAGRQELLSAGFTRQEAALLEHKDLARARALCGACAAGGIRTVTMDDREYPSRLRNIEDPPILLYVRGTMPALEEVPSVAVVGTRSCTEYGLTAARRLGRELAENGIAVITGLARGIDTAAAEGALEAGGTVVGVCGCGPDVIYPPENGPLYASVMAHGAVLSEFSPGTEPAGRNFPIRNRVMSGMSLGVVVVEAPLRSGALITAYAALEQGRDVFAVPGPIDAASCMGSNRLLREGAIPATCGDDVAQEYKDRFPAKLTAYPAPAPEPAQSIDIPAAGEYTSVHPRTETVLELSDELRTVALAIDRPDMAVDEIIAAAGIGPAGTLAALTQLEIEGAVVRKDGKRYTRIVTVK